MFPVLYTESGKLTCISLHPILIAAFSYGNSELLDVIVFNFLFFPLFFVDYNMQHAIVVPSSDASFLYTIESSIRVVCAVY